MLIEEYERYASLYDDDAEYYFGELFEENATITSDMIGSPSYLQEITASQYINQLRTYSKNTTTSIKDVAKGKMNFTNGKWHIPVSFRKSLSYIDPDGYIFSIADFYSKDFSVVMNIVYDEEEDRCLISSIDGSVSSDKKFPSGRFYIIDKNQLNNRDARYLETLRINNQPLEYGVNGVIFANQGDPSVDDADVIVTPRTLSEGYNYDVVSFSFKQRSLRLKPHFSWAPIQAYKVFNGYGIKAKSSAMEAGLDFGVTFPAGRKCKMGLYFGAGLSMSNLDLRLESNISYDCNLLVFDKANMVYVSKKHTYNIKSATERVEYKDLYIPIYFDFEFVLGKHMLLSFNFGAKGYLNMSAKVASPYTVNYTINGVDYTLTPDSFIIPNSYAKRPYDISGIANLGLDVNLYKKRIYLTVGAGYEYGFNKSYESTTISYEDSKKPILPVMKKDGSDRLADAATLSLIGGIHTMRNAIWFTTGLKFKL